MSRALFVFSNCIKPLNWNVKVMSRVEKETDRTTDDHRLLRADRGPVLQCLVVASDPDQRLLIGRAVSSAGWTPILCASESEASRAAQVRLMQLAFVVLQGSRDGQFDALLEQLAGAKRMLVVVCGNQDAIDEEIYARQLGAWFYLPGLVDGAAVTSLCAEARRIDERARLKMAKGVAEPSAPKGSASLPRSSASRARSRRVR